MLFSGCWPLDLVILVWALVVGWYEIVLELRVAASNVIDQCRRWHALGARWLGHGRGRG